MMSPDYQKLEADGYALVATSGSYVVAYKDQEHHLMGWSRSEWRELDADLLRLVTRGVFQRKPDGKKTA